MIKKIFSFLRAIQRYTPSVMRGIAFMLTACTLILPLSSAGVPALAMNVLIATLGLLTVDRLLVR